MGYNSTVVVLNDALNDIAGDTEFGAKLANAISKLSLGSGHVNSCGVDISAGSHCNAATAIESHHADGIAVVAVGGNCGVKIGEAWYADLFTDQGKFKILEQLAREFGYSLTKDK